MFPSGPLGVLAQRRGDCSPPFGRVVAIGQRPPSNPSVCDVAVERREPLLWERGPGVRGIGEPLKPSYQFVTWDGDAGDDSALRGVVKAPRKNSEDERDDRPRRIFIDLKAGEAREVTSALV